MRIEVAPGVSLAGRTTGFGPDVLLVHGWMMAGAVFDRIVPALAASWRVTVPDLRGTGDSSRPATGHSLPDHVSDLAAWLREAGLQRPAVVGHSMGGAIAQLLAARHPELVASLVLLNPVPLGGLPLPPEVMARFASAATDRTTQGEILDMATLQLAPADREWLLDIAATVSPPAMVEGLRAWTSGGHGSEASAIRCPTRVVATSDPFLPPDLLEREVVRAIPGATLHLLEGPGHYPQVEAPRRTADLVGELLA